MRSKRPGVEIKNCPLNSAPIRRVVAAAKLKRAQSALIMHHLFTDVLAMASVIGAKSSFTIWMERAASVARDCQHPAL